MHRVLAVFLLTASSLSFANTNYDKYASLISDIRDEFRASSAFIVFSEKDSQMDRSTMAHSLTRALSELDVSSLITNFNYLPRQTDTYGERLSRPLLVFLMRTRNDISTFRAVMQDLSGTMRIWLVIFHGHSGDPICEYCRHPSGNVLGLSSHTPMIVVCCDDPELQEWWSVLPNETEIGYFGTWTANERLKVVSTDELKSRHRDYQGKKIRIHVQPATPSEKPFKLNDHALRLVVEIVDDLGRVLNFTKLLEVSTILSVHEPIDRAVDAYVLIAREQFLNALPLYPLDSWPSKLYIKVPDDMGVQWFAYFKVFEIKIWLIIIALIITTSLSLTTMKLQYGEKLSFSLYIENCLCVWGIFNQQGLSKFPTHGPMKIAYLSIFVSGIIVYVAYSAKLISFLTVTSFPLPFSDLSGFVEDGSYRVITTRHSHHHVLSEVCEERVAFFTSDADTEMETIGCKVVEINTGRIVAALAVTPRYQFADAIKYHLGRINEFGIFRRPKNAGFYVSRTAKNAHFSVDYSNVAPVFVILAGGIILALVVFLCETTYRFCENRRWQSTMTAKRRKTKIQRLFNSRQ